ncbi:MAG: hypothetical protein HeimC3_03710 [Candidatus Heimdallarchaeota archaeon LC_3]|nr:MAG: hypothetical protein HeimC3_03710 [Candidatus Heimdallarchaeota archaeon LC_3]
MKLYSYFPFSACGICQSFFIELFSIDNKDLTLVSVDTSLSDLFIIPSMIKKPFLEDLKNKINYLPFPRKIIAVGDSHLDLGDNFIYTPDYFSVDVIQGCPINIDDFIKVITN